MALEGAALINFFFFVPYFEANTSRHVPCSVNISQQAHSSRREIYGRNFQGLNENSNPQISNGGWNLGFWCNESILAEKKRRNENQTRGDISGTLMLMYTLLYNSDTKNDKKRT